MSVADKLTEIASGQQVVYASGYFSGQKSMIADTVLSTESAWSSRHTVDTLCPTFTESGSVVGCEPVEGYPLTVTAEEGSTITRCGKNLINPSEYMAATKDEDERTTLDGDVFTTRFTSGGIHVNMRYSPCKSHSKGTYTFSFIPLTEGANAYAFVYAKSSGAMIAKKELLGSNPSLTFTANEEFYVSLGGINGSLGTYSYKLQLEAGTTATEYEPYREAETFAIGEPITAWQGVNTFYADTGDITITGKADPTAIIQDLCNKVNALSATVTALTGV